MTLHIKGLSIGEGAPKICVPLVGRTSEELIEEAIELQNLDFDLVEWRVDFFQHVDDVDRVTSALHEIRKILIDKPLVFTFRSAKEGGEREISARSYFELNKAIAETKLVDMIDVELFTEEAMVKELVEIAHVNNVYVIISNHDFQQTPSKEEIISRLRKAQDIGGDVPKIAVMPQTERDVLTLLDATLTMKEQYADRPIITMSMAGKGVISRLSGEIFGSAVTFGAAKKPSAPGQVEVSELRNVLTLLHKSL
ncbi:type I 3-dehydroquinate dehydratase [Bacillus sp. PS06]|uniref:type I 3-dehydroquinate dehydratase n=1 Tax=Bacillus sp. PS06 TaxID=2764176 RepID=UPI001786D7AC|nr:type I 3-dehydroquinate dehydratase [Bacillus sp. PS06]MBD8070827.1 type I 3-dehydroquinate dehydratase [Bacillus sp. PS06]